MHSCLWNILTEIRKCCIRSTANTAIPSSRTWCLSLTGACHTPSSAPIAENVRNCFLSFQVTDLQRQAHKTLETQVLMSDRRQRAGSQASPVN